MVTAATAADRCNGLSPTFRYRPFVPKTTGYSAWYKKLRQKFKQHFFGRISDLKLFMKNTLGHLSLAVETKTAQAGPAEAASG